MSPAKLDKPAERKVLALHRWRKIVGVNDPDRKTVWIECSCGHVAEGATFKIAMIYYGKHRRES